ncbi:inaD-like protein isoform X1 [Oncorhynchus kisutch]|uniref:inaD-like protein isoform X1 n=1 Tax=Oncorhynchus kisutch TaxID=8019 RepID=UPI0012DCA432|nr:inaD-like protein isoform X1 [Oncorhynchus kisutch]
MPAMRMRSKPIKAAPSPVVFIVQSLTATPRPVSLTAPSYNKHKAKRRVMPNAAVGGAPPPMRLPPPYRPPQSADRGAGRGAGRGQRVYRKSRSTIRKPSTIVPPSWPANMDCTLLRGRRE